MHNIIESELNRGIPAISPPPYHLFECLGKFFLFDTSTSRFYSISEFLYVALEFCLKNRLSDLPTFLTHSKRITNKQKTNILATLDFFNNNGLFAIPHFLHDDKTFQNDLAELSETALYHVQIMLTDICNLSCSYCFCEQGRDVEHSGFMTTEQVEKALDFHFCHSGCLNTIDVLFIGGEPLLNKTVLLHALKYGREKAKIYGKKITYRITTNGTLIDDEIVSAIKEYQISLNVSFDGPQDIQDRQCPAKNGSSSFENVLMGIKKLQEASCFFEIRSTLTKPIPDLKNLISFYSSFNFLKFSIVPASNPFNASCPICYSSKDIQELLKREREILPWVIDNFILNGAHGYSQYDEYIKKISSGENNSSGPRFKCHAAVCGIVINVDGSFGPCSRLGAIEGFRLGNLQTGIDIEKCKHLLIRHRDLQKKTCGKCWAFPLCGGFALCDSINVDSISDANQSYCLQKKAYIENAAYIYFRTHQEAETI